MVVNLYREMLQGGEFEPLIMVNEWSAFRPIEKVIDGRRTVYMRFWSPWPEQGSIVSLFKWILSSPFYCYGLLSFSWRYRVRVFNFHYPSLDAFPIALLRFIGFFRGTLILSFHGLDLGAAQRSGRIDRLLWKFVLYCTTAIVACSRAFANDVRKFAGNAASRVRAVQNGIDIDCFLRSMDRSVDVPMALRDRQFIVSVATWEQKKGLDVLVNAFAEVRRTNPGLALVLVGRSGGAEPNLRALASELMVAEDVFFLENVPHSQVGIFLEHAKVFCLPSRAEPFGIAILEAGIFRLPVVASRVGGIPEIVIDGETGLLVGPDNVKELAAALGRVLSDTDLARDLGERLYRRVVNDFSWKRAYQEYRTLML